MHARNSTSLPATRAEGHSETAGSFYVGGLVEDMEPLPTAGLVVKPLAAPTRRTAKPTAEVATLAITRVELAGEGALNRVWRTGAHLDGRPVVLRIAKQPAHQLAELEEAGRIEPLVTAMHDRHRPAPGHMPVLPARIFGQVDVPMVTGDLARDRAWESAPTVAPEVAHAPGATQFRTASAMVMEEAEGVGLKEALAHLKKNERMPIGQVRDLIVGMAQWIEEGRKAGLVHTDLKTANVMLADSQFTLVDHTPTRLADLALAFGKDGGGVVKGTFGYSDFHGMQKAAAVFHEDHNEAAFGERVSACQLRAVAVMALECLNGGKHPVTNHPHESRRGYMGAVEPETYEHALQQAQQRYNQEPAQTAAFIAILRDCIHRRLSVGDVATRVQAISSS